MSKTIYISGPITGYDIIERREMFRVAKEMLLDEGWAVMSPLENGLPAETDREQHMKRDLHLLTKCDAIFVLPGWDKASGCICEVFCALQCGMEIITWNRQPIDFHETLHMKS